MERRLAARRAQRADPAFERSEPLLQHRHRRVRDAGVDMPGALQVEQRRGVVGILEDEGGREIERHRPGAGRGVRSEEHTSELQSLMRISYAVFCLKKKK